MGTGLSALSGRVFGTWGSRCKKRLQGLGDRGLRVYRVAEASTEVAGVAYIGTSILDSAGVALPEHESDAFSAVRSFEGPLNCRVPDDKDP